MYARSRSIDPAADAAVVGAGATRGLRERVGSVLTERRRPRRIGRGGRLRDGHRSRDRRRWRGGCLAHGRRRLRGARGSGRIGPFRCGCRPGGSHSRGDRRGHREFGHVAFAATTRSGIKHSECEQCSEQRTSGHPYTLGRAHPLAILRAAAAGSLDRWGKHLVPPRVKRDRVEAPYPRHGAECRIRGDDVGDAEPTHDRHMKPVP